MCSLGHSEPPVVQRGILAGGDQLQPLHLSLYISLHLRRHQGQGESWMGHTNTEKHLTASAFLDA